MRISIAARQCDISDSLRERTEQQMARLTKYHPRVKAAEAVFTEEKRLRKIEVILSVDGSEPVIARAEGQEFRTALDKVVDRLRRVLRRKRDLHTDHQAPPLSEGAVSGLTE